jgi:hypothetical protein
MFDNTPPVCDNRPRLSAYLSAIIEMFNWCVREETIRRSAGKSPSEQRLPSRHSCSRKNMRPLQTGLFCLGGPCFILYFILWRCPKWAMITNRMRAFPTDMRSAGCAYLFLCRIGDPVCFLVYPSLRLIVMSFTSATLQAAEVFVGLSIPADLQ